MIFSWFYTQFVIRRTESESPAVSVALEFSLWQIMSTGRARGQKFGREGLRPVQEVVYANLHLKELKRNEGLLEFASKSNQRRNAILALI